MLESLGLQPQARNCQRPWLGFSLETGTVETGTVETGTVETGTVETGTVETGTVETGTVETETVAPAWRLELWLQPGDWICSFSLKTGTWIKKMLLNIRVLQESPLALMAKAYFFAISLISLNSD